MSQALLFEGGFGGRVITHEAGSRVQAIAPRLGRRSWGTSAY